MAYSTVCQSKWKPIVEPRRAKPKTYRQAPSHWLNFLQRGRHWVLGSNGRRAIKMFLLTAVRHEVSSFDKTVVVHELELAIKRVL